MIMTKYSILDTHTKENDIQENIKQRIEHGSEKYERKISVQKKCVQHEGKLVHWDSCHSNLTQRLIP